MNPLKRPDLKPGTEVEGFVVEAFLGAGGFGTVYRVKHRRSGALFALKFIPLMTAEARGLRESIILLRVHHPNLVAMWGSGYWPPERQEYLWLQLEHIAGPELDQWADETNPDALEVSAKVLGVARGLAVAHEARVVHRDVKEANILVRESDGEAVLLDFGVGYYSRALTLTEGMFPPGTLPYRSPEAWRFLQEHSGQQVRYRPQASDDLYALGIVLYRLLTQRHPFLLSESERSIQAIIHQPPLPPHILNPRVPPALSRVCLQLLAKTPEQRYPNAVALCEELHILRRGADGSWRVPLLPEGRRPRPRPIPRAVVAWTAAGLGLVGGAGGWHLLEARRHAVSGAEVASTAPAPEAARTAGAPPGEPTPAALTSPAQESAPVKKHSKRSEPRQDTQRGGTDSGLPSACAGLVGLALQACVGAQPPLAVPVRLPPPPEECPAGFLETTWKVFGLGLGNYYRVDVIDEPRRTLIVQEGPFSARVSANYARMPIHTLLTGRLYYTPARVYVRFTQARVPSGQVYPVCMELREEGKSGFIPDPGSTADHIQIYGIQNMVAVERFE